MLIDRIGVAQCLAAGRRVLDIGGEGPILDNVAPLLAREYRLLREVCHEYKCLDIKGKPDYQADLNTESGMLTLALALDNYRPEVVLAMEVLEHLQRPDKVVSLIASAVQNGATAWITVPNAGNWIVQKVLYDPKHDTPHLWEWDTNELSALCVMDGSRCRVQSFKCLGFYDPRWPLALLGACGKPTSWGYLLSRRKES